LKNNTNFKLNMDEIKGSWTKLADREELAKKYPNSVDTKSVLDITFATERDASLVDFIDSTNGKVLSRHKAGFAVHVTVTNKANPRYAYSISRSGRLTMFDIAAPGQPAIASVQVGYESRGLAVSPDGKLLGFCGHYLDFFYVHLFCLDGPLDRTMLVNFHFREFTRSWAGVNLLELALRHVLLLFQARSFFGCILGEGFAVNHLYHDALLCA
jgi:hypothetical protein